MEVVEAKRAYPSVRLRKETPRGAIFLDLEEYFHHFWMVQTRSEHLCRNLLYDRVKRINEKGDYPRVL